MGFFDDLPNSAPVETRPVPVPPVDPQYEAWKREQALKVQEPIQYPERRPMTEQKKSPLYLIFGIAGLLILAFLLFVGAMAAWKMMNPTPQGGGGQPEVVQTVNPAEYFIEEYKAGMSQLYAEAASKATAGDFKDIQAALEFVNPNKKKITEDSFVKMAEMLEAINGENWSNDKAAKTFSTFAEGFKK